MAKSRKPKKSQKPARKPKKLLVREVRAKQEKRIDKKFAKIFEDEKDKAKWMEALRLRNLKRAGISEAPIVPVPNPSPPAPIVVSPPEDDRWDYIFKPPTTAPWIDEVIKRKPPALAPKPSRQPSAPAPPSSLPPPPRGNPADEYKNEEEEKEGFDEHLDRLRRLEGLERYRDVIDASNAEYAQRHAEYLRQQAEDVRKYGRGKASGGNLSYTPALQGREIYVNNPYKVKYGLEKEIIESQYDDAMRPLAVDSINKKNTFDNINFEGDLTAEGGARMQTQTKYKYYMEPDAKQLNNELDYVKKKSLNRRKIEDNIQKLQTKDKDINEVLKNMAYMADKQAGNFEKKNEKRIKITEPIKSSYDWRGKDYVKLKRRPLIEAQQKIMQDINNYYDDTKNNDLLEHVKYNVVYEDKKNKFIQDNKKRVQHYLLTSKNHQNDVYNIIKSNSMASAIKTGLHNDVPNHQQSIKNSMIAAYTSMTDASRKLAHNPRYFNNNPRVKAIIAPYPSFMPTPMEIILRSQAQALAKPI